VRGWPHWVVVSLKLARERRSLGGVSLKLARDGHSLGGGSLNLAAGLTAPRSARPGAEAADPYGRMRYDQADHQWSPRVSGGSAARTCPSRATHSLQIHTATIAEVLGSMVRRLAWKSIGTCSQDVPRNLQRIEGGSS